MRSARRCHGEGPLERAGSIRSDRARSFTAVAVHASRHGTAGSAVAMVLQSYAAMKVANIEAFTAGHAENVVALA
jgi:hypothetical protein